MPTATLSSELSHSLNQLEATGKTAIDALGQHWQKQRQAQQQHWQNTEKQQGRARAIALLTRAQKHNLQLSPMQLAAFSHSAFDPCVLEIEAFRALCQNAEFNALIKLPRFWTLLNDQGLIRLFNHEDFINNLNAADFLELLQQPELIASLSNADTLSKITTASRTNPSQFAHWPKLASTTAPVLGYFDTGVSPHAPNQRAAIKAQYALALDTRDQTQIETAVQQGQINTLIHPYYNDYSVRALIAKPLYRDFVALGGRLIVNLYGNIPEQFLNQSFGWALDYTTSYGNNNRLNASGLTGTTPTEKDYTYCVAKSSLPAGAKAFLTLEDKPNEVAGFYMRYGLGEVIGIGYNWRTGTDAAWDALLQGLIAGTALTYQRRYAD